MAYVYEAVLDALRGLRIQNETMVMPNNAKGRYVRLYHDAKDNVLNVVGTRSTLQCFAFPKQYQGVPNLHPRLAFELSCLDVAEQLGYTPSTDILRPVLMDLLLDADFPRFRYMREAQLEVVAPMNNVVQYLLTTANMYLKG